MDENQFRTIRCPVRLPALGPAGWLLLLPPGLVFVPLVGRLSVFFLLAPILGWPPRLSVACLCPRLSLPVCLPAAPCSPRAALLDVFAGWLLPLPGLLHSLLRRLRFFLSFFFHSFRFFPLAPLRDGFFAFCNHGLLRQRGCFYFGLLPANGVNLESR